MKSELRKSAILTHPMLPKAHFSGSERPSDAEKEEDLRAQRGCTSRYCLTAASLAIRIAWLQLIQFFYAFLHFDGSSAQLHVIDRTGIR